MKPEEIRKLDAYFKRTFANPSLEVKARPRKDDSCELYVGDEFLGIAETDIDNTGGINGTYETKDSAGVLVASYGIVKIDIAASTFANLHDPVYASGANTAVLVATSNTLIGKYFNKADGAATAAWLSFDAR